jgi:hypothetical protein
METYFTVKNEPTMFSIYGGGGLVRGAVRILERGTMMVRDLQIVPSLGAL